MAKDVIAKGAYKVIKYGLLAGVAVGFFILAITSLLVRDTAYIQSHPWYFLSELVVVGGLSALPVMYVGYMRRGRNIHDFYGFLALFAKIAAVHLGFELSGVYKILLFH